MAGETRRRFDSEPNLVRLSTESVQHVSGHSFSVSRFPHLCFVKGSGPVKCFRVEGFDFSFSFFYAAELRFFGIAVSFRVLVL